MFNRPGSSQSRGPHRLATLQVHYGRLRTEGHTKVDRDFVDQVLDAAARVVAGGAISANGHGNVSAGATPPGCGGDPAASGRPTTAGAAGP